MENKQILFSFINALINKNTVYGMTGGVPPTYYSNARRVNTDIKRFHRK